MVLFKYSKMLFIKWKHAIMPNNFDTPTIFNNIIHKTLFENVYLPNSTKNLTWVGLT